MADFVLPGPSEHVAVLGKNGTGKTILGAWIQSRQNFHARPYVAIDFKDEEFWDMVGNPPMRNLALGEMPGKKGIYRLRVYPGQEDELEEWLWKVWRHGNIGLFCDEVSLMPKKNAFKAILRQGRSKHIPVIACTQRPVDCDREVFTEAKYIACFRLGDERDYKIVRGFVNRSSIEEPLPRHWCYWWDDKQSTLFKLRPCPPPDKIAANIRQSAPYQGLFGTL